MPGVGVVIGSNHCLHALSVDDPIARIGYGHERRLTESLGTDARYHRGAPPRIFLTGLTSRIAEERL